MKHKEKRPLKSRSLLIIAAVLLLIVILGMIATFAMRRDPDVPPPVQQSEEDVVYGDESLGIDPEVDKALKDYRNVVLFGVDTASVDEEVGHRSDGIIILSINKNTDNVNIFSIYRDTYLKIDEEHGLDKINHAYAYGGMQQSIKALNRNLDLNIREGISLTWDAIEDLVNSLNGVVIDVQSSEIEEMNKSLSEEDKIRASGQQLLNGKQAVIYSRIRYDSAEGDFRRNERMQAVLIAALSKAKTLKFSELVPIMYKTVRQIKTNMSISDMKDTLMKMANFNIENNLCWPYNTRGWMYNDIYYGVPVNLKSNVRRLHFELFDQTEYEPTEFVQDVSREIEELSGYYKEDR